MQSMTIDMIPQEAATELRHIADIYVTPAAKQACLMGEEAIEKGIAVEPIHHQQYEEFPKCENVIAKTNHCVYCMTCGQALDRRKNT